MNGTIPYRLAGSTDVMQLRPGSRAELDLTNGEIRLIRHSNWGELTEDEKRRSYEAVLRYEQLCRKYYDMANPGVEVKGF